MSSSGGFKPSHFPPINSTGMKGFLEWYAREQPGVYKKVAPQIVKSTPAVFSDYTQSQVQGVRANAGRASMLRRSQSRSLTGLGDDSDPFAAFDTSSLLDSYAPPPITMDVAAAANSSAGTSTNDMSWISSLIGGITGAYTTVTQAQTAQQITQLQLQRAQQGLPPLNIGMNANGIPTIAAGLSGTSLLLVGGIGIFALLMMSRGGAKAA